MDSEELAVDPLAFHSPVWDQIITGNQIGKFGNLVLQNELVPSHMLHFPSGSCLADDGADDVVPKIPCFGSGFGHIDKPGCLSNIPQNQNADCQEKHHQSSSSGKRKRKNVEEHKEDEDKKNVCSNSRGFKQAKDNSIEAEPSKENYIHVRARRGQATNSHSLAERVRRERISERMKMLQELVPGCNKITGKAVMLDEIINYVQSLQQQVEFLSMKLATVNPNLNVDLQNILSKDIIRPRFHSNPGLSLSSTHPFLDLPQGGFPSSSLQPHPFPQNLWNGELLEMGFGSLGPNGDQQI